MNLNTITIFCWWLQHIPGNDQIIRYLNQELAPFQHQISVVEYKSNEAALAKLTTKNPPFDVVIVTSRIAQMLHATERLVNLKDLPQQGEYLPFIRDEYPPGYVLPFQWGSHFYLMAESLQTGGQEFLLLNALSGKLMPNNTTFILPDDLHEVVGRFYADYVVAENRKFSKVALSDITLAQEGFLKKLGSIQSDRIKFANDTGKISQTYSLAYNWNGEVLRYAKNHANMKIHIPKIPSMSAECICVLKNSKSSQMSPALRHLVQVLASPKFLRMYVSRTGYFSPYAEQSQPRSPYEDEVIQKIRANGYLELNGLQSAVHDRLNKWWQKLRYGVTNL